MEDNNHTDTKKRMSVAKSYREIKNIYILWAVKNLIKIQSGRYKMHESFGKH